MWVRGRVRGCSLAVGVCPRATVCLWECFPMYPIQFWPVVTLMWNECPFFIKCHFKGEIHNFTFYCFHHHIVFITLKICFCFCFPPCPDEDPCYGDSAVNGNAATDKTFQRSRGWRRHQEMSLRLWLCGPSKNLSVLKGAPFLTLTHQNSFRHLIHPNYIVKIRSGTSNPQLICMHLPFSASPYVCFLYVFATCFYLQFFVIFKI